MKMSLNEKEAVLEGMGEYFVHELDDLHYAHLFTTMQRAPLLGVDDTLEKAVDQLIKIVYEWMWDEVTL